MKQNQLITLSGSKTTLNDVVRWVVELRHLHIRIASCFARPEPRHRSLLYLQGILSDVARKNGWQLAEHAGETRPDGMQRLLTNAVWDEDLVRDELRNYVLDRLGDPDAIVAIDETSFPKRGTKSAGVAHQYCGTTKQVENCQVGVFLSYISHLGHTLLDRELYLPRHWVEDRARCQEAGIPETVLFQTKCELARAYDGTPTSGTSPSYLGCRGYGLWQQSGSAHVAGRPSILLRSCRCLHRTSWSTDSRGTQAPDGDRGGAASPPQGRLAAIQCENGYERAAHL